MGKHVKLRPSKDRKIADSVSLDMLKNLYFYLNLRDEKGFKKFKKKALQLHGAKFVNSFTVSFWIFKDEDALLALFCEKFHWCKQFESLGALRAYVDFLMAG